MQTTRFVLFGVGAVFLLAGCGSAASSSSSSAAAGAASTSASAVASASQAAGTGATSALGCSLAPSTLVGSDLGMTGLGAAKQTASSAGAACLYNSSTGIVSVEMFNGATSDKVNTEEQTLGKTEQTKALSGLGDQAFSASLSVAGVASPTTLVARKGSVEIMIVAPASVSAEQSLAQHLFAKIG
jgi:hypothetical protein